jgi:biofilm protein TabA
MALFGSLQTLRAQLARPDHFRSAFDYLEECLLAGSTARSRILGIAAGKTERIDLEDGTFALEQSYLSKLRADGFFESHRAYIDIQMVIAGEEFMEVADVGRLSLKEDLTPAKDLLVYHMFQSASVLRVSEDEGAVFFPADGHMPSLAIGPSMQVWKTVVKVPVV